MQESGKAFWSRQIQELRCGVVTANRTAFQLFSVTAESQIQCLLSNRYLTVCVSTT